MNKSAFTPTESRLTEILIENCEVEADRSEIEPHWTLFDINEVEFPSLHMDSLAALELIICVHNEFGVQLDKAPKGVWFNVKTLAAYIDENRPS